MIFQTQKPLKEISTFGIGGPAAYYIEVSSIQQLSEVLFHCFKEKLPYFILGKGSNTLFDDQGFDGLVIHNKINFCEFFEDNTVEVGAGYSFSLLGVQTARKGLSGLEFASGIPASVGGAVFMNAGASGAEVCNSLTSVKFVDEEGKIIELSKEEMTFSYRKSSFQGKKGAIASAKFTLETSAEARKKQLSIIEYRTKTQPYGEKSAGCVFRNPENLAAARLIQECGLKGVRVGDAEVSLLHANFIINRGGASAKNILALAELIQDKVKQEKGIQLELEIRSIPYRMTS